MAQKEREYEEINLMLLNQLDESNASTDVDLLKKLHYTEKNLK